LNNIQATAKLLFSVVWLSIRWPVWPVRGLYGLAALLFYFSPTAASVWCGRRRYTYTGTDIHAWGHAAK